MTGLVSCNRGGGNAPAVIHILAEVDGLLLRIVMIGKASLHRYNLYIIDSVVAKHFLSNIAACQASVGRYL
jgi:hypothetical protein